MSERRITLYDRQVYWFLVNWKRGHNGNSPSIREIVEGTGFNTTSSVFACLGKLRDFGYIRWNGGNRQIELVGWEMRFTGKGQFAGMLENLQ